MSTNANQLARTGLQYSLGLLLIYECSRLILSRGAHTHISHVLVMAIAAVELLGAILFLIPPAKALGGKLLLITFAVAAVVHLLHGQPDIGFLIVYAMAVLTVITA